MKISKRVYLTMLLTIAIILTIFVVPSANAVPATKLNLGSYVQFGRYLSQPIIWRVINKNADGSILLFSEKILCLKAFDAAESGNVEQGGGAYTEVPERQYHGSNNWENSNIREWLNSKEKKVSYSTQSPVKSAVLQNSYDKEAGFLYNFTKGEQELIQSTTHKALMTSVDLNKKQGGSEAFKYNYKISNVVQNYDKAYYQRINDKVFLLDVKELHDFVYKRKWEYRKIPTDKAIQNAEFKFEGLNVKKYWKVSLRTPSFDYSDSLRFIGDNGGIYGDYESPLNPNDGSSGIVPALHLKSKISASKGAGTISNPYIIYVPIKK